MKILFVSYHYWPPYFGGALLHTVERLESLAERGHKIDVFTSGVEGLNLIENKSGFTIHRSNFLRKGNNLEKALHRLYFFLWAIIQLIRRDYEIVHLGSMPGIDQLTSGLCGLFILMIIHLKKAKAVYLYSLAETGSKAIVLNGIAGYFYGSFLRQIDVIVVNSAGLYESMHAIIGNNIEMIINGVKDDVFILNRQIRDCIRAEYSLHEEIVFVFVGSIEKRKGVDILLEAFESLIKINSKAKLWIIGPYDKQGNQNLDERESSLLLKQAMSTPGVTCWGRIDERAKLNELMNASDVFVFPTLREGMPMAPLQAMSCGLPVIISRIPGITDLANIEGETGLFVQPGDLDSLQIAMLKLAGSAQLRVRMGAAAVKRIHAHFGWQKHVSEWEDLYRRLSEKGRRS